MKRKRGRESGEEKGVRESLIMKELGGGGGGEKGEGSKTLELSRENK